VHKRVQHNKSYRLAAESPVTKEGAVKEGNLTLDPGALGPSIDSDANKATIDTKLEADEIKKSGFMSVNSQQKTSHILIPSLNFKVRKESLNRINEENSKFYHRLKNTKSSLSGAMQAHQERLDMYGKLQQKRILDPMI
jgi:hypothetical protein